MISSLYFLISVICVIKAIPISNHTKSNYEPVLLIVSYDGFRNEYFNRSETKYMQTIREFNSYTDYMLNIFPTKTFPNHHTISTGLNAADHGVTSNSVYDQKMKTKLEYGHDLFHYNNDITPIWILNQNSHPNRYSGCMMWPGSDFEYQNKSCYFKQYFNRSIKFNERVDTVIQWITDPSTPANLVLLYIEDPDYHAHAFGPKSDVIAQILIHLDELTQYIQTKLRENNLLDRVNVIHLSDHGMESVIKKNIIDLTNILKKNTYKYYGTSPVLQIVPMHGNEKLVYEQLVNASKNEGHFQVYTNNELLERWKYRNDQRTGPITVVADVNYGFNDLYDSTKHYENLFNVTFTSDHEFGIHGYDTELSSMHPFFMAYGPQIKKNYKTKPFHTLSLYNLFCKLLKIDVKLSTEDNTYNAYDIIRNEDKNKPKSSLPIISSPTVIAVESALTVFGLIVIVSVITIYFIYKKRLIRLSNMRKNEMRDESGSLLQPISGSEEDI